MQILDVFSSCYSSPNKNLQLSYATMILKWAFSHLNTFLQFPPSCSFVNLPHQCLDLWYFPSIDAHIFSLPPSILWFVFTVTPCCWLKRKILKANLKFLQQLLRYALFIYLQPFGNGHALHVLSWFYSRLQYDECLYSIPLRFPEKGIINIELPILKMRLFFFPTDCRRGKYWSWFKIPGFSCCWITGISYSLYIYPVILLF